MLRKILSQLQVKTCYSLPTSVRLTTNRKTAKLEVHLSLNPAPIDLVVVIDKSGSMRGGKLELVQQSAEFMVQQLKDDDRVSVVSYDTNVTTDIPLTAMTKEGKYA